MRTICIAFLLCGVATCVFGQLKVNPQVGLTFVDLSPDPSGVTTSAALGFQLGADLRLGDRLYFQPGAYFGRNATVVKASGADTSVIEDNLIRTTAKVKALLGFDIIHGGHFKLRANAGPSYTVLLSVDSKDDKIDFNKHDFNSGSFNMDAGIGLDITVLTLETGISYGLSQAYKDEGMLLSDSKYFTFYITAGLVFGGGK